MWYFYPRNNGFIEDNLYGWVERIDLTVSHIVYQALTRIVHRSLCFAQSADA